MEWRLDYKQWDSDVYVPIAGYDKSKGMPIGYSHRDILLGNLTFFRGPSYFEWYTETRNMVHNIDKLGEWRIVFFHISPDNEVREHYNVPSLMIENISYNNSSEMAITRFVNYSEYFFNVDLDISLNYGKSVTIKHLLEDIVKKYINIKKGKTTPHVTVWKDMTKAIPYKASIDHFSWKGNGVDMLYRLAERYALELLFDGDRVLMGEHINIGLTKKKTHKYKLERNRFQNRIGAVIDTVVSTIAPFPGHNFKCDKADGRNIVVDYYCGPDGATCHVLTLDLGEPITEREIVHYQRLLSSNLIKNRSRVQTHSLLGLNKVNEKINFKAKKQNRDQNYKKLYHDVFPPSDIGLKKNTKAKKMIKDISNFKNYDVLNYQPERNIRTLRSSPFAGNDNFMTAWTKPNKSWGVQYPHMEGDLDVMNLLEGDRDKSVTIARMWVGDQPTREDPMDYRMTFVDGSTIYESVSEEMYYIVPRKGLLIYPNPNMIYNSDIWTNPGAPAIRMDTTKVTINEGNRQVARKDDKIKSVQVDDATFWGWMKQIQTWLTTVMTLYNSHVHVTPAGPSSPTVSLITVPTPTSPSSLTGKIIEGNEKFLSD